MPAKKWLLCYEVTFKLHSGMAHEEFVLKADTFNEGLRRLISAVILYGRKHEGVFIGAVLKDAKVGWQPVIAGVDVAN